MRRQSSKTIPPSSKVVPEIEHTMSVAAIHLPSLPSPENIDAPEKGTEAPLQEMDNTKSLPGQSGPEKRGDEDSCQRCPLSLVITKTSSPPKSKFLSNQPKII